MTGYELISEYLLCFFWSLTYTLVLVSTLKHHYPMISPYAQIVIAPFEFSVFASILIHQDFSQWYVFITYLYWTIIEIAICVAVIKVGKYSKKFISFYITSMLAVTVLMVYLVAILNHKYFFSYFNSVIGDVIWLFYVAKKEYPVFKLNYVLFAAKFVADAISVPVYISMGSWLSSAMCVAVPLIDLLFIAVYFEKNSRQNRGNIKK